jgi:hypothetical protein
MALSVANRKCWPGAVKQLAVLLPYVWLSDYRHGSCPSFLLQRSSRISSSCPPLVYTVELITSQNNPGPHFSNNYLHVCFTSAVGQVSWILAFRKKVAFPRPPFSVVLLVFALQILFDACSYFCVCRANVCYTFTSRHNKHMNVAIRGFLDILVACINGY